MKLRNKKTGEIIELLAKPSFVKRNDDYLQSEINTFNSLTELNEEWEDVTEEPFSTSFYTIVDGKIKHCIFYRERVAGCPDDAWAYIKDDGRECIKQLKEVGSYFETEEEAEKAVRKLKAWKRLKDKGFNIYSWDYEFDMVDKPAQTIILKASAVDNSNEDLDLLFGGEE